MKTYAKKKINTKKTRKKFNYLKCAPLQKKMVDSRLKDKTCYSNKTLFMLRDEYNKKKENKKIISNDPYIIWNLLKKYNTECLNEKCWIKNEKINKLEYFRPKSPKSWINNPYTWLDSNDIIKVMNQYEKKYKDFKFIGPSPIDFDDKKMFGECIWKELCNFNLIDMIKKKIYKVGIILNLDPHYKGGSHWVAIFIDVKNKFIFYFDSNGKRPNLRIKNFIKRVKEQGKNYKLKYYDNFNFTHQKRDGQCGMYCLYIIIKLLRQEKKPLELKNIRISDEEMRDYRKIYFNS